MSDLIVKTHYRTHRAMYDTQTTSYQERLELSKCRAKSFGLNMALFKGALLWNKLPNHLEETKCLICLTFANGQGGHVSFYTFVSLFHMRFRYDTMYVLMNFK